jgi:hypothetical protein
VIATITDDMFAASFIAQAAVRVVDAGKSKKQSLI